MRGADGLQWHVERFVLEAAWSSGGGEEGCDGSVHIKAVLMALVVGVQFAGRFPVPSERASPTQREGHSPSFATSKSS